MCFKMCCVVLKKNKNKILISAELTKRSLKAFPIQDGATGEFLHIYTFLASCEQNCTVSGTKKLVRRVLIGHRTHFVAANVLNNYNVIEHQ